MNVVNLSRDTLIDLGNKISDVLSVCNVKEKSTLEITVDNVSFKKIDEDLFFRGNEKEENFEPSEDNIQLNFHKLLILIKKGK